MWASYKGHVEVVDELLERGAFPNVQAHVSSSYTLVKLHMIYA